MSKKKPPAKLHAVLEPENTVGTFMPLEHKPEPTAAAKLTSRIEQGLRTIDQLRDSIRHHERQLAQAKESLSTELLNHQAAQFELSQVLSVPALAH